MKGFWGGLLGGALVVCVAILISNLSADEFSNPEPIGRDLPYEGVLDFNGVPAEGQFDFVFVIYESASSSDELWNSGPAAYQNVEVEAGRFSVVFTGLPDEVFETVDAHLAITVNSQLLSGRQKLHSVPFAVRSAHAMNGVPSGTIVAFGGTVTTEVPPGWLLCNGAPVSRTTYPDLEAAIGETWGAGTDGAGGDSFSLPDLRGQFLRGADLRSSGSPDAEAPRAVGEAQGFSTARPASGPWQTQGGGQHRHDIYYQGNDQNNTGATLTRWDPNRTDSNPVTNSGSAHNHPIIGGDPETRPINRAVNFIIKY